MPAAEARSSKDVVVITGASGFLGRALIERLAEAYDIVGLDFRLPPNSLPSVEMVRINLTEDASVQAALARIRHGHGSRIASVIHLAGYYDLTGEPNPKYDAVTVRGTERLLRALGDFKVEQFIFASTLLVHAPTGPGRPVNEQSPLRPKTPYPDSKLRTETLLREQRGKIPIVNLRLAGIYDEGCHAAFLAQQIAHIYERQLVSYVYPGNEQSGQPYLHLADMTEAMARLIERRRDLPGDLTLLLGEPETMSYGELQAQIGQLLHGEEWETLEIPKVLAKAGQWVQEDVLEEDPFVQPWMIEQASDHYELDLTRVRQVLDWEPQHRLRQTLPAMIAALKADPPRWYRDNKLNAAKVAASGAAAEKAGAQAARTAQDAVPQVEAKLQERHRRTLWAHLGNAAIGLWLIASPVAYGLFDMPADLSSPPAAGHVLPPSDLRDLWLGLSEMFSGAAIALISILALARPRWWAQWLVAAIGLWLLFAPLVFWTTSAAAYAMDTLLGMLVMVLAVMVPSQPGISRTALASNADLPLGWSYSPSSYVQRVPIVALAGIGLLVSRYLAAYQLGHIDAVWDPVFGGAADAPNGTATVITSSVSKAFPIADAGFGAIAYALDMLTGAIGDQRRWRTMPWLVLAFGFLVIPLGFVSVGFIIIQPTIIGALCLLCLIQTAITIILIPYSVDEMIATLQYLAQSRRIGRSLWRVLLYGGPALREARSRGGEIGPVGGMIRDFVKGGVSYPWSLVASVAVGIYLMLTKPLFGSAPPLYFSDHVAGCLIVTIAVAAMAEVARPLRFLNIPIGLWVAASPFILTGGNIASLVAAIIAGLGLAALSLPRGERSAEHYGSWDRLIV